MFVPLFLVFCGLVGVQSQTCTFPAALVGKNMISNSAGVLVFTASNVTFQEGLRDCKAGVQCPPQNFTFSCQSKTGEAYFLRSQGILVTGQTIYMYICWYLSPVSDQKWVYYQGPHKQPGGVDGFYNSYVLPRYSSNSVSQAEVCNLGTPLPVDRYNLLLDSDTLMSQSSACPDAMLATFTTTLNAATPTNCTTQLDICSTATRQTVYVNDTSCSPNANSFYAFGGKMDCLHSLSQNDVTYVMTFATDNGTFACLAYLQQGNDLYITQQANRCDRLEAPTNTTYDAFLRAIVLCPYPCEFPTELSGNWLSSRKGAVTLTATELRGLFTCASPTCSANLDTLECYRTDNNKYLLRTPVTTISNQTVRVYVCLQLTKLSSTKYLYYQLHRANDAALNDYVVTFNSGQSVSFVQACDDMSGAPYKATRHSLLISSGSMSSAFIACPADLEGQFNNTDNACQSTLDVCDDVTKISVTGTACSPKPFYSSTGSVGCLYSLTVSGTTYLTVYNMDGTSNGNSTFDFTCVALGLTGATLKLSQNPLECVDSQTSDSITSTQGAQFTYDRTATPVEIDLLIILLAVFITLLAILIIVVIICIFCRKKRAARRKREEEEGAILQKTDDEGSDLSLDSGYPQSSITPDGRGESRGRGRRGVGTPRSHFAEVYEVAEEEDPKQVNVVSRMRHRHRHRYDPHGKDGVPGHDHGGEYETDEEWNYSDASWEEYVDEEGNTQVRQIRRRRRQRRRKKVKHKYTKTRVLEDGTTIEEEVESEYSITASSDVTSSGTEGEDISEQIREAKRKRRTRLQKIMARTPDPAVASTVIVTRDMHEKANQPEKKRRSFWDRLKRRARDRKTKTKVLNRGWFEGKAGMAELPGVTGEAREIPYLMQYRTKKDLERVLNDEGFFNTPEDKLTAETIFGFHDAERELSPKPQLQVVGDTEEERMATATDSSQSDEDARTRDQSETANEVFEDGKDTVIHKDQPRHVTIDSSPASLAPSSDSEMKESEDTDRKSEDTSSGVADLSPDNSPPSPDQPNASDAVRFEELEGLDGRRLSLGWEKVQTLYLRSRLQGGKDSEDPAAGSKQSHRGGKRFNSKRDKRVRTALRRLLNERLFGNVKKKSRRDDDNADNWTNADSVGNNVSVASSAVGTRTGTRQTLRSVPQGKVAFADEDIDKGGMKGRDALKLGGRSPSTLVKLAPGAPQRNPDDSNTEDESAENIGQERQTTRSSSRLPPLRTPQVDMSRVFTPANYPKWGLCVTASQRSMLVDGLERDRTFLSRQHAKAAWNSKGDDDLTGPPRSQETRGGDTTDDESYLDPHRPDTDSFHNSDKHGQQQWAHKRADHRAQSVAFTNASGRSPLDLDDRRLRRLLEELYRDKKFMDKLINKIDEEHLEFPNTIAAEDVKFLSEFGRQYLLERALYWEQTGPLGPPRPPPTALGMRIKRAQTMASGMSHSSSQDMTSPRPKTVR